MNALVLAPLAVMVLLAGEPPAQAGPALKSRQVERVYQDLEHSVVRVEVGYASIFAPPGAGSGVVIGDGLIATADHVVAGATELWVLHPGGRRQRAAIVKRAPEHDLALLRIEEKVGLVPVALRHRSVQPGQCVVALGNVMGWGIGIFAGIVSLTPCAEGCSGGATAILTDITTPPGLSGGALVACGDGALVGIISFGLVALNSAPTTAGIVGAVPAAKVAKLLEEQLTCTGKANPRRACPTRRTARRSRWRRTRTSCSCAPPAGRAATSSTPRSWKRWDRKVCS